MGKKASGGIRMFFLLYVLSWVCYFSSLETGGCNILWEQQRGLSGALQAELSPYPEEEAWLCFNLVGSCLGTKPQLLPIYLILLLW